MKTIWQLVIWFGVFALYSLAGIVYQSGGDWYDQLRKPLGTPPAELFGIVWTILYALIALSFVILFKKQQLDREIILLFLINWVANQGFTYLFFGHQLIFPAAIDTLLVAYSTYVLMITIFSRNRFATYLLLPYLLWSIYAVYLAWGFYARNI